MVELIVGLVGGAILGYFGHWARLKFLDDPRQRQRQREDVMRLAAASLRPALEPLRAASRTATSPRVSDPSSAYRVAELKRVMSRFIRRYEDEWTVDMDKDAQVSLGVRQVIDAWHKVRMSHDLGNPETVTFGQLEKLGRVVPSLHRLLVQRSKGDWKAQLT